MRQDLSRAGVAKEHSTSQVPFWGPWTENHAVGVMYPEGCYRGMYQDCCYQDLLHTCSRIVLLQTQTSHNTNHETGHETNHETGHETDHETGHETASCNVTMKPAPNN